jgi:hypothetical protein
VLGAHGEDRPCGRGRRRADDDLVDPAGLVGQRTSEAWSVRNFVPKRSAWSRMVCMSSGPMIPSRKPGKFSTSVVCWSRPPQKKPSMTSGSRFARAVYSAAV